MHLSFGKMKSWKLFDIDFLFNVCAEECLFYVKIWINIANAVAIAMSISTVSLGCIWLKVLSILPIVIIYLRIRMVSSIANFATIYEKRYSDLSYRLAFAAV